jgi:hypothetical protein
LGARWVGGQSTSCWSDGTQSQKIEGGRKGGREEKKGEKGMGEVIEDIHQRPGLEIKAWLQTRRQWIEGSLHMVVLATNHRPAGMARGGGGGRARLGTHVRTRGARRRAADPGTPRTRTPRTGGRPRIRARRIASSSPRARAPRRARPPAPPAAAPGRRRASLAPGQTLLRPPPRPSAWTLAVVGRAAAASPQFRSPCPRRRALVAPATTRSPRRCRDPA